MSSTRAPELNEGDSETVLQAEGARLKALIKAQAEQRAEIEFVASKPESETLIEDTVTPARQLA